MTLAEAVATITDHRDKTYPHWSHPRGLLNYVLVALASVETHGNEEQR